jgi:NAD(P)-dependent dehydrogenase (short-subunit alcohol dehydrogenase family)
VVTGASRGFGEAIAVRFAEEGALVVCVDCLDCDNTLRLIGSIQGIGDVSSKALYVKCDIADESQIKAMVSTVVKKFGTINILVNNAALFVFKTVEDASAEDWDRTCAVNIRGSALVTKHVIPVMKAAGGGAIIFQGSISAFLAQPGCATYSITKAAMVQMAKNSAMDLAQFNIRVNSVCAGTIETPISKVERVDQGWTYEQWEAQKVKDVMMRRVGQPREVANATLFYASEESSYCTGGHLMVDGGQTWCTVMPEIKPKL